MVTNLPAEAKAKFAKYMEAKTPEEKLRALEEFLSAVPKHKGTENLVRWIKRRMRELREEIDEKKRRTGSRGGGGSSFSVEKEGAAQVVMLGLTKSGKSLLLSMITGAKAAVSDVPYTTKYPIPGMLKVNDIDIQLVEAPSLFPDGSGWTYRSVSLARNADGVVIVLDASRDYIRDLELVKTLLNDQGIYIEEPKGYIVIERAAGINGIRILNYGRLKCTQKELEDLLKSYRIFNALVKIHGEVDLDVAEKSILEGIIYRPGLIVVNKVDLIQKDAEEIASEIRSATNTSIPIIAVSALKGINLDLVGPTIVKRLQLIRVYTKPPTGEPSKKPVVLKRGATVRDVAAMIHSDFVEKFAYARIWGPSAKYPGQRVGLDHVLEDSDIVEINLRK